MRRLKFGFLFVFFFMSSLCRATELPSALENYENVSLEILVVSPALDPVSSSTGNVALGIKVLNFDKSVESYTLSFLPASNEDKGAKQYAKSVAGLYATQIAVEDYEQFYHRNVFNSNRVVRRYVLEANDTILRRLFSEIAKYKTVSLPGRYSLFSNNSASYLANFLVGLGYFLNHERQASIIPVVPINLRGALLGPALLTMIELPSSRSGFEFWSHIVKVAGLNSSDLNTQNLTALTDRTALFSNPEINFLLALDLSENLDLKQNLRRQLLMNPGKKRFSNLELFNMNDYPNEIYKICEEATCAQLKVEALRKIFGDTYTKNLQLRLHSEMSRSRQLSYASSLSKTLQWQNANLSISALQARKAN